MLITDILVLAALFVFLITWWQPKLAIRSKLLWISALVALVAGIAGASNYRWQDGVGAAVAGLLILCLLIGLLRKKPRTKLPWISGTFIALLVAVAALPIYLFPVSDLPAPSGKHPVGTRYFELTDTSRTGLLGAKENEARRLLVRTWYPAGDITGLQPRGYLTDQETDHTITGVGEQMSAPFLFQYFKHTQTHAYPDAPVLTSTQKLPVVVYSHGFGIFASQNSALMEELASHGYVVYSIQHTGNAVGTIFANGDVVDLDPAQIAHRSNPEAMQASDAQKKAFAGKNLDERYEGTMEHMKNSLENGDLIIASAPIWLGDRQFVMNQLEQGTVPSHIADLAAASDMSRTGQIGMSFGGSTTGGICMVDSRCAAGVNLDGGDFHSTPLQKNIPVPFLMMYSDFKSVLQFVEADEDTPLRGFNDFSYERPELAEVRDDVYRFMVKDATHAAFSDFTLFMRDPFKTLFTGAVDGPAMIQIQNDFVLGFFDTYLRGKEANFPQAQQQAHAERVEHNDISDVRDWWLAKHPEDVTEQVVIETDLGEIEIALYPQRAPIAVQQFLGYVTGGHFDGTSFYRATSSKRGDRFDVVQGGLLASLMLESKDNSELMAGYNASKLPLSAITHETTDQTGMLNERGTLSFGRIEVGSANSEFFFNLQDNPSLDTGFVHPAVDGQGYTAFGRVMRGMRVLEQIQGMQTGAGHIEGLNQQLLVEPATIIRAYKR